MSTKTNFKRIALIAVASLGLGILSSVPSQAAVNADTLTIKNTNGGGKEMRQHVRFISKPLLGNSW